MKAFYNRAPLTQNQKLALSPGRIRPEGWLKTQIVKLKEPVKESLNELWPACDIDRITDRERAAYALDALVTTAYALDDEELKQKTKEYMDALIRSKREDGWFYGAEEGDYWPLILILRAVYAYFCAAGDKRALVLMDGFFKYEYRNLSQKPLEGRACARCADNIYIALRLFNITGQKYLLELCKKLKAQMIDWTNVFSTFPNVQPMSKSMSLGRLKEGMLAEKNGLMGENHPFFASYYHQSHGVNVAFGLKAPGVVSLFKSGFKELNGFKYGWEKLMKYHGTALGMFTCDEHLNGSNPSAGVSTAAIAEAMLSMETLMDAGDFGSEIPDALEKLAYNGLEAALDESDLSVQQLQQTNQIGCLRSGHAWYNSVEDANVYSKDLGREGYLELLGALSRFCASLWQETSDDGLSCVSYAPCSVSHVIDSVPVRLEVGGSYPFGESVEISFSTKRPVEFPLYLRIPFWAVNPMIYLPNGEIMTVRAGETACLRQQWSSDNTVKLILPRQVRLSKWSRQSIAAEIGPLLMALPLKAETKKENGTKEYSCKGEWRYVLAADGSMKAVTDENAQPGFNASAPCLKVLARVCKTDAWAAEQNDAGAIPIQPQCAKNSQVTAELIPYGATRLRIAQFATAKVEEENA